MVTQQKVNNHHGYALKDKQSPWLHREWIKGVGVGCPADNHQIKLGCPPKMLVVHTIEFNIRRIDIYLWNVR